MLPGEWSDYGKEMLYGGEYRRDRERDAGRRRGWSGRGRTEGDRGWFRGSPEDYEREYRSRRRRFW
jgi:hypothetical protein